MSKKPWIFSLSLAELSELFKTTGEKPFRAKQVFKRLYGQLLGDPDEMKELPKNLREKLPTMVDFGLPPIVSREETKDGRTVKVAIELAPNELPVEAVLLLNARRRPTFCLSSQLGCVLDCTFCSTATMGFQRNLTAAEMIYQVWVLRKELLSRDLSPSHNIVFMGMGEPLANRNNLSETLSRLHSSELFEISWRNMTVSTAGVVEGITWMAEEFPQVNLALSLNAASDTIRRKLMPSLAKHPIKELISAMVGHYKKTGRRPTFEYVLLDGINADPKAAKELVKLLTKVPCLVNLIPFNGDEKSTHSSPPMASQRAFHSILEKGGIKVTLRRSPGKEIRAGCGQLATKDRP